VLAPGSAESWTVIGSDLRPGEPVERYLAWLSRIERAPTTVRAYAHDLRLFWEFLESRQLPWDSVSLEQLGEFTAWLRAPAENVVVLETGRAARSPATVNRILTAVFGFFEFHARHGVGVAKALVDERRIARGGFKPFLHGIAKSQPRGRVGRLREDRRLPATLSVEQVAAILAGLGDVLAELLDHEPDPARGELSDPVAGLRVRALVVVGAQQAVHELCRPSGYADTSGDRPDAGELVYGSFIALATAGLPAPHNTVASSGHGLP